MDFSVQAPLSPQAAVGIGEWMTKQNSEELEGRTEQRDGHANVELRIQEETFSEKIPSTGNG